MDDRALNDTLKPGRGLRLIVAGNQIVEFGVDVIQHRAAQFLKIDVAGAHDSGRVGVVDQRQQQMLQRGKFLVAFIG